TNTRGAVPNWEIDSVLIRQGLASVVVVPNGCGIPFQLRCLPPPTALFPLGVTMVTCVASNEQRATASCSFALTVRDTTPPQITCPTNTIIEATSASGAVVSYAASASDLCGVASLTCSPASGT